MTTAELFVKYRDLLKEDGITNAVEFAKGLASLCPRCGNPGALSISCQLSSSTKPDERGSVGMTLCEACITEFAYRPVRWYKKWRGPSKGNGNGHSVSVSVGR